MGPIKTARGLGPWLATVLLLGLFQLGGSSMGKKLSVSKPRLELYGSCDPRQTIPILIRFCGTLVGKLPVAIVCLGSKSIM